MIYHALRIAVATIALGCCILNAAATWEGRRWFDNGWFAACWPWAIIVIDEVGKL